mmetsp:Transcript_34625/g.100386  ORF Transcript_34625/g.100386 Transcript_34625/m.100386 type:complete len:204 (-) Transcript_34625:1242-1853(-)
MRRLYSASFEVGAMRPPASPRHGRGDKCERKTPLRIGDGDVCRRRNWPMVRGAAARSVPKSKSASLRRLSPWPPGPRRPSRPTIDIRGRQRRFGWRSSPAPRMSAGAPAARRRWPTPSAAAPVARSQGADTAPGTDAGRIRPPLGSAAGRPVGEADMAPTHASRRRGRWRARKPGVRRRGVLVASGGLRIRGKGGLQSLELHL